MRSLAGKALLLPACLLLVSCVAQPTASPATPSVGPVARETAPPLPVVSPAASPSPTTTPTESPASPSPLASIDTPTPSLAITPTATATPVPTATDAPSPTITPGSPLGPPSTSSSPTPDPYAHLTIDGLTARSYGEGELVVQRVLGVTDAFTRTLVTFPSDGLTIYGFMNVPRGSPPGAGADETGPYPVVLVLHGYVDPAIYTTLTYTTRYADALARAGYLVIHPNFRNWPPSDSGPEEFRVGQAVDVLHLIALVQKQGGRPGPLALADSERIGLWGHSMGGGISQRVLTVSDAVDAAVLYGSMTNDEVLNHRRILFFTNGVRGLWETPPPEEALRRISPKYYLRRITSAVSIHHGSQDEQVPLAWSEDLCRWLSLLGMRVECFTYPGQPHTFVGDGDQLFIQRTVEFFDRYLGS